MAIPALGFACRSRLPLRSSPLFPRLRKASETNVCCILLAACGRMVAKNESDSVLQARVRSVTAVEVLDEPDDLTQHNNDQSSVHKKAGKNKKWFFFCFSLLIIYDFE